ncbi:hypothetical protein NCU17232 [Neurospora crassa OR74A]|uniref:Uncharacterized protein n=1 Tax=Neurospora crassa (strain ATCC 24698 / 74-OR23-1A / CBS 708.71 / DSM 1257 / FGSC 987) TaxID=367110 RepID=V5IKL2_NEUCR|nr:hypothetical protein NCU17232 [Neurospora crassa OR74A]ESA41967.1 hypothetical protein NCU17232 [Neurospora crassa OR74A]|eukprot:XP_011395371.1 hypothetical protein NCU17232 [Neurospora crassa OR74A]
MHDGQCFGIPEENVRQGVVIIGCFASHVPRCRCCITALQAARKQDCFLEGSQSHGNTSTARRGSCPDQRGWDAGCLSKGSRQLLHNSIHFLIAVSGLRNRPSRFPLSPSPNAMYCHLWPQEDIGQV